MRSVALVRPASSRHALVLLAAALITVALLTAIAAPSARAQEKSWRISDVDVLLDVQEKGDVLVSETVTFDFTGSFSFVGRVIPTGNLENLTDIEVLRDGVPLPKGGGPNTYQTFMEGDDQIIQVNFDLANTSATWTFNYRAVGAIHFFDEGDELRWYVFDAETPVPIDRVQARVELPGTVPSADLSGAIQTGPGVENGFASPEASTLVYEGTGLPPNTQFWIVAGFPKGVVQWVWTPRRVAAFIVPKVGFALPIIAFLSMLLIWRSRGRDAYEAAYAGYVSEPPSDLPPGIAGALLDEKVEVQEVLATIVDLAHRGYIEIEEEKEGVWILAKTTTYFKRLKSFDDLRGFERSVADALFESDHDAVSSDDLKNKFYKHVDGIINECYDEVTRRGFFNRNPNTVRAAWLGGGIALAVVLGGLTVLFAVFDIGGWGFFAVGSFFAAFIVIGFSRFMPQRTPAGAREQRRWEAFRNYLRTIDRYQDQESARDIFEAYLPYAIAFGVEKDWVRRFDELQVPAPPWFHPMPRGGWDGDPTSPGRPMHVPIGMGGAGGGGIPGGGLSLDTISDSLFNSLNHVSTVMTSRPSSGGSGKGAWGGGGGGGFGGGFSGGGGGGGFRAG